MLLSVRSMVETESFMVSSWGSKRPENEPGCLPCAVRGTTGPRCVRDSNRFQRRTGISPGPRSGRYEGSAVEGSPRPQAKHLLLPTSYLLPGFNSELNSGIFAVPQYTFLPSGSESYSPSQYTRSPSVRQQPLPPHPQRPQPHNRIRSVPHR